MSNSNIAVIGAGITGITTAYALAKRGYQVTIFDRHPFAAMETSYANGGQLSASNAEVWNSWRTVFKGLKWVFSPSAPLLINPRPSWHKISWLTEFMLSIPRYEENTVTTARLAIAARKHLFEIAKSEGIDFNCEERGILHFYATKHEFDHAARVSQLLARGGLERRPVTPTEISSIEPTLKGEFYGGYYTPSDFTGDIHKFTTGLAKACDERGVTMRFSTSVESVRPAGDGVAIEYCSESVQNAQECSTERFDKVVICSGVFSRKLAQQVGDRINIYPVKGYSITVNMSEESDRSAAPWVSLLDDQAKIVTSRLGPDRFRVAGTAEFNGSNKDIRMDRIQPLVNWVRKHFPELSTRQVVPWAGLRPMMPDMLPYVGRGRHARVFYNTGHGHLGWTLSAATADLVAEEVSLETVSKNRIKLSSLYLATT